MLIKINNVELPAYPSKFLPSTMDLDNGETTQRTIDGTLQRDRIAVKHQLDLEFGLLTWDQIATIHTLISGVFFNVYYPDPSTGGYVERTMYVSNRTAGCALFKGTETYWSGFKFTLIEK